MGSDDEGLDVIRVLKAYEKSWGNDFGNFQLQRKLLNFQGRFFKYVAGHVTGLSLFLRSFQFLSSANAVVQIG